MNKQNVIKKRQGTGIPSGVLAAGLGLVAFGIFALFVWVNLP